MEKIKKIIKSNYHFFSLAVLFFVIIGIMWHGGYHIDDYTYKQAAVGSFSQIISFLKFHCNEVNGRNLVHFFVILFLRYDWELYVWRFICAASVLYVCYSLGKLSSHDESVQKNNTVLCCILYCIINPNMWRLSVCWLTGSFNYILPFALLVALIVRYLKKEKADILCAVLALLGGATTEQMGMMFIGFFVLMILNGLIKSKKIELKNILYLTFSAAGYSTIWLSPGTFTRLDYYSVDVENSLIQNAVYLLKMNWFENTGMIIFNAIFAAVLVFWLFRLKSEKRAVNVIQRIAAAAILVFGAGNTLFTAVIYCFGFNVSEDSIINKAVFVLWAINVVLVLVAMCYIAVVLYLRGKSDAFIISVILGIGDQLMLILVYNNRYRTMLPSLLAFMMIILITADEIFRMKPFRSSKVISVLLVLVLVCGTGHYLIGKDSIRGLSASSGCDVTLLDENGEVRPLSDEELEKFCQWLKNLLSDTQKQETDRKGIMDFSYIPAVNKYNSR